MYVYNVPFIYFKYYRYIYANNYNLHYILIITLHVGTYSVNKYILLGLRQIEF